MSTPPPIVGIHPKLETPDLFPDLHTTLNVFIRLALTPLLPERYTIAVERGLSMSDEFGDDGRVVPDVRIDEKRDGGTAQAVATPPAALAVDAPAFVVGAPSQPQRYIAVRRRGEDFRTRGALVATIEVLSPANKTSQGRAAFEDKQTRLAARGVHLVEVDLLRRGQRRWRDDRIVEADYVATVLRAGEDAATVWPIRLGQALPTIPIPLRAPDADVPLALEAVMQEYLEKTGIGAQLARSG